MYRYTQAKEIHVSQEIKDFTHFRDHQLKSVDYSTGQLNVWIRDKKGEKSRSASDVGSLNQDGYSRVWCNGKLRMKHRLLFWLYHGTLPDEVDHDNGVRNDNSITNLIPSNRSCNTSNKRPRSYKQLTYNEVCDICERIVSNDYTITGLAKEFGKSRTQIKAILAKKYWTRVSDEYF